MSHDDRVVDLVVAVVRMRDAAAARAESRISALNKAKEDVASRTTAAIDVHSNASGNLDAKRPQGPNPVAIGRGFRVRGKVTAAEGGLPIQDLRLRIVDGSGVVQLEKPSWTTGPDGHFLVDVTAAEVKMHAGQYVEIADAGGNPLQRLDNVVAASDEIDASVALEKPPAGSVLERQIAIAATRQRQLLDLRTLIESQIDALQTQQASDHAAIDAEIGKLQAAVKSLSI